MRKKNTIEEIKELYFTVQSKIVLRSAQFKQVWRSGREEDLFAELIFCILTPQSRAKSCWAAVEKLEAGNLLLKGNRKQIAGELGGVRFQHNKAESIVKGRKMFLTAGRLDVRSQVSQFDDVCDARDWLVQNVRGLGYKEASHFLRNIGLGEGLAILDRHILRNLKSFRVVREIPDSLSRKKYLEIEEKMSLFARKAEIPMSHLDLLLWYKETGEIFK